MTGNDRHMGEYDGSLDSCLKPWNSRISALNFPATLFIIILQETKTFDTCIHAKMRFT